PRAALDQPASGRQPEAGQAAAHQIRAVRSERYTAGRAGDRRNVRFLHGHDDLADMPRLLEIAERFGSLSDREDAERQRPKLARVQLAFELFEEELSQLRTEDRQVFQVDRKVGELLLEGTQAQLAVLLDVALADLHEAPEVAEHGQAAGDGLPAQGVQHDV